MFLLTLIMRDPAKHKSSPITPTDSLITTSFKLKRECLLIHASKFKLIFRADV